MGYNVKEDILARTTHNRGKPMCDFNTDKKQEQDEQPAEQAQQQDRQRNPLELNVRAEQDAALLGKITKPFQKHPSNLAKAYHAILQATPEDRKILSNRVEFNKIMISQLSAEKKKEALDALFEKMTNPTSEKSKANKTQDTSVESEGAEKCENKDNEDPTTSLLLDMILARFGVAVGSCRVKDAKDKEIVEKYLAIKKDKEKLTEKTWTQEAATHLYRTYLKAPQSVLDMVICVITFDTCVDVVKRLDAETYNQESIYKIDYNNKDIEKTIADLENRESKSFVAKHNAFDHATLHELAHIIDRKIGFSSPNGPGNFRNLSNWDEHSIENDNDINELVHFYHSKVNENVKLTPEEDLLSIQLGNWIIKNRILEPNQVKNQLQDIDADKTINKEKILNSYFIFDLISSFYESKPWYNNNNRFGMGNIRIHEANIKDVVWYSYNYSILNSNRISKYQSCSPSEEFAEIFSSYYMSITRSKEQIAHNSSGKKYFKWFEQYAVPRISKTEDPS